MTEGVTSYKDLQVWRRALDLAEAVYLASRDWPLDERFGLISQVRRASVSVPSNVAEGSARKSTGEFLQFLGMARGSLAEVETQLILARRLGYLSEPRAAEIMNLAEEVSRMLVALAAALKNRKPA